MVEPSFKSLHQIRGGVPFIERSAIPNAIVSVLCSFLSESRSGRRDEQKGREMYA